MKSPIRLALLAVCLLGNFALGESYHAIRISALEFTGEKEGLEAALKSDTNYFGGGSPVNLRCEAEGYAGTIPKEGGNVTGIKQGEQEIVFRLEDEKEVKGFVDLRLVDEDGLGDEIKGFAFTFTPGEKTASTEEHFKMIRSMYTGWQIRDHVPGTSWFRHLSQSNEARPEVGGSDLSDSFGFFSGGRAVSENLALDRELILSAGKDGKTVPLSEIEGVTVPPIDWKSRLPEGEVEVDKLSLFIPEDQHAVFAKSLPDLLALIERGEDELMPSAQAYSVRNPFRKLASRYQKQMGLDVPAMAARLIPVESLAITGGDAYFPLGTDVAVIFYSENPDAVYRALMTTIMAKAHAAGADPDVPSNLLDCPNLSFTNADRSFSSYLWKMGNVVVVSNSAIQMDRLFAVADGKATALGSTDEFRYFRSRYPLAEKETAFVFLSDATIRRWAGPELRIAASRRTRAVTAMGELTSRAIDGVELGEEFKPLLGKTEWKEGSHLTSEVFGTLGFVTPSSELAITTATVPEKQAYEFWRRGYESGWTQAFDPIAIRITDSGKELSADLSIMPLTAGSDYAAMIGLLGKAKPTEMARWVPEESAMHFAFAIDTEAGTFKEYSVQASQFIPGLEVNPLAWMAGDVSVELEKSLFWQATEDEGFDSYFKAPLVVRIASNSRLKLALFMTAVRREIEKSAPDSVRWETRKVGEHSYVVARGNEDDMGLKVCYATLPDALIISLSEDALLRAMLRERHTLTPEDRKSLPAADQIHMESSPAFLAGLENLFDQKDMAARIQEESWKALPILNEWHRRSADKDPVALQTVRYGEDIYCPGGKGYRWNAEALTMESGAFGHPSAPRMEPAKMPGILDFENVRTGITFQDSGLRANLTLGKAPARIPTPPLVAVAVAVAADAAPLATAAQLFPLKEGRTLHYKGKAYGTPDTMKQSVRNVRKDGDATLFDVVGESTEEGGETYSGTTSYQLHENLVVTQEVFDDGNTQYTVPYIELPASLVAGQVTKGISASVSKYDDGENGLTTESGVDQYSIRIAGKEDITVPAGEFKGCIRVEVSNESLFGGSYERQSSVTWYHPDVGMVKYECTDEDTLKELTEIKD
jgi:hypothetical protein